MTGTYIDDEHDLHMHQHADVPLYKDLQVSQLQSGSILKRFVAAVVHTHVNLLVSTRSAALNYDSDDFFTLTPS